MSLLLIINIIFCIISSILVAIAPDIYSHNFCVTITLLFITQNLLYFLFKKERNLVCFEFFFMISFFFTNFVYPVFYYPNDPYISVFIRGFNQNIITKSTAIAYFAYTFFLLTVTQTKSIPKEKSQKKPFVISSLSLNLIFTFTLITFGLYVITGGLSAMREVYSGNGNINDVGIYSYFNNFFTIFCYLLAMFIFRSNSKFKVILYGITIIILIFLLLTTGTRGIILGIGLILITSFNDNVKKIPGIWVLLGVFVGTLVLTFVVFARSTDFTEGNWLESGIAKFHINSVFDLFMDLIINNRNLYVLIDYTDTHQLSYFSGMMSDITAPIPKLFGYIAENSNIDPELLLSGNLPTYLELGANSAYGLGTNMVGEAYYTFGLGGVVFFFSFLGFIIRKSRSAMNYNIYAYLIYFLFVSHAVFYPRAPILFNPRIIIWSLAILFLIINFTKKEKKISYS